MPRARNTVLLSIAGVLVAASAAVVQPGAAGAAVAGSATAGDPYFPNQGNGGYDVRSYDLNVAYTAAPTRLAGTARIRAVATADLSRFDLDLRRTMHVSSVSVNGASSQFSQPAGPAPKLVVTPSATLVRNRAFTVVVTYAGNVVPVRDPDGAVDGAVPTDDGLVVASEPQGSPTWFPVNDTPRDKATYAVSVSVPAGLTAVSNGALIAHATSAGRSTWSWRLDQPVSSYLVTLAIGRFDVTTGRTRTGVPYFIAVDPREHTPVLGRLPDVLTFFTAKFGPYPFGQTGAIVDHASQLGFALETATRPVYDKAPTMNTLVHELAHQWFGDSVTVSRWRDIWLNEGFAQFARWLWDEHTGGPSAQARLRALLAVPASNTRVWNPPPGDPGSAAALFAGSIYNRGAGTLEALRLKVGDPTFFRILQGWARTMRFGNARVDQFTAYAAQVSHRNLTSFFREWLYRSGKPQV